MTTTQTFADAIGRKKIADAVGVNKQSVSNAVVRGVFPGTWYVACSRLAAPIGIQCPPDLFGQKGVDTPNVDASSKIQDDACIIKSTGAA